MIKIINLDKYFDSKFEDQKIELRKLVLKEFESLKFDDRIDIAKDLIKSKKDDLDLFKLFKRFDSGVLMKLYEMFRSNPMNVTVIEWDILLPAISYIKDFTFKERFELMKKIAVEIKDHEINEIIIDILRGLNYQISHLGGDIELMQEIDEFIDTI